MKKKILLLISIFVLLSMVSCDNTPSTVSDMDTLIWYDIDISVKANDRPDNGWHQLSPDPLQDITVDGGYRSTTPLMGLYDQQNPGTYMQHLYWFEAAGIDGVAYDLTNWRSLKQPDAPFYLIKYNKGVLDNARLLHETIHKIDSPVDAYPTLRLNAEEYDNLQLMLDDIYEVYQKYPESWYKLDDGSENKEKPFIVIFADWDLLAKWAESGIPFQDKENRFNIRWSNGFLANFESIMKPDGDTMKKIPADLPYWLFVENEPRTPDEQGYYKGFYKEGKNKKKPEQMITWASIFKNDGTWDGMIDVIDGKKTLERYSWPLDKYTPQALLINRWNYPQAWKSEPQEGLSLNHCTNIEPNVNFGFEIYNDMTLLINRLKKGQIQSTLPLPEIQEYNAEQNRLYMKLDGFPLEIRIAGEASALEQAEWQYIDVAQGVSLEGHDIGKPLHVQTRNAFGQSPSGEITVNANGN